MRKHRLLIQKHLRNMVYSNMWIALAAGAASWQTSIVIDEPRWFPAFFVALATLFTYNFQRLVKMHDRQGYRAGRNQWIYRRRKELRLITLTTFLVLLGSMFLLRIESLILLVPGGFLALAYVVRLFRYRGNERRYQALRDLPFLKLWIIAFVWALATVLLPITEIYGSPWGHDLYLWLALEHFFFIVAITIPFDIRDMRLDARTQRTIPQVFGVRGARLIMSISMSLAMCCSIYLFHLGAYELPTLAALVGSYLIALMACFAAHVDSDEMLFTGFLDGSIIFQALLVWLSL